MIRAKNAFAAPLIAVVLLLVLAAAAQANTIVVNVHDDPAGSGDCQTTDSSCSLRQAITTAQPGDMIQLQGSSDTPVTYTLTQGTNLEISQDVTVAGQRPRRHRDRRIAATAAADPARRQRHRADSSDLSMINGIDGHDETARRDARRSTPRAEVRSSTAAAPSRSTTSRSRATSRAPTRWAAPSATASAR